jgi:hypothetical protein
MPFFRVGFERANTSVADVTQRALVGLETLVKVHVVSVVRLVVEHLLAVVALEERAIPFG